MCRGSVGLGTELARPGHRMKAPHTAARACVVAANLAVDRRWLALVSL